MTSPIAAILFAAAAAAPAPPPHVSVITNPDWARKPTYEEVMAHYPQLMTVFAIEGYAVLRCEVSASGDATGCKVGFESPGGLGFGTAALEIAPLFKFIPKKVDGQPVDGGTVNIPIHFTLDQPDEPESKTASVPPPAPADPQVAALCRRFAELMDTEVPGKSNWAEMIATQVPVKAGEEGRESFVRAYEAAHISFTPKVIARRAELCAGRFSRPQLETIVTFLQSPAGQALMTSMQAMAPQMSNVLKYDREAISALAVKNYCAASPAACPDPAKRPHN